MVFDSQLSIGVPPPEVCELDLLTRDLWNLINS